ncbi:MAG: FecR domain-containing protein [Myxococcota bacterium]
MTDDPRDRAMLDQLAQLARETASTGDEVAAIRRGLSRRVPDGRVSRALLRHLPPVDAQELAVVRARVDDAVEAQRRTWLVRLGLAGGLGGLALAATAVVAVGAWLVAAPVDAPLALAVTAPGPIAAAPGVALVADGTGEIGGTARAPRIAWTGGRLDVEVDPGKGIALSVVTREATVEVIGTVFSVDRSALGTTVAVTRGKVHVACAAGADHTLTAGDAATCVPTTGTPAAASSGLLGRANLLKKSGAPAAEVLTAVEAGLPLATGPFRSELLALDAEMLHAVGRSREARDAADRYLADPGGSRRAEVLAVAAAAAIATDGCPAAMRYLSALEELGAGDPALLERCEDER